MLMSYKAVLFDLDGTLLDTLTDLADAANYALRVKASRSTRAELQVFRRRRRRGSDERALPTERCDAATLAACVNMMRKEYARAGRRRRAPMQGFPNCWTP